ncbi:MAG: thiamine pyrophosphate-binding protein [Alphaproteobacteria bacterium]
MPELPDIEAYLHALRPRIQGRTFKGLRIANPFLLRSVTPKPDALAGQPVAVLRRIGKRIAIGLANDHWLVLHLMIAGRLQWRDAEGAAIPGGRGGQAAFDFDGGTLLLTEAGTKRRAALHLVASAAELAAHDPGGIEPLACGRDAFAARLRAANHTLKRALTDPQLFSGIGNAYSDEILLRARLSPVTMTASLDDAAVAALHDATVSTLTEWRDRLCAEAERAWPAKVTAFRDDMAAHGRFGRPCPQCGAPIQRIRYADNETNYCPRCQTGGKVLADRSLIAPVEAGLAAHAGGAGAGRAGEARRRPLRRRLRCSPSLRHCEARRDAAIRRTRWRAGAPARLAAPPPSARSDGRPSGRDRNRMNRPNFRHGGALLAEQLARLGCERVFCVPGESYLAALDGLYDQAIDVVTCRHEGGATVMAEADGKLTGRPGVAFVTRGPGATHGSVGVHIARQDSTPMILFVGQVGRSMLDREAFQEVDYRLFFAPLAKWVAQIDRADRIPEYVARAWSVAMAGRPGPVVLALPEDMLSGPAEAPLRPPVPTPAVAPAPDAVAAVAERLASSRRPVVLLGGSPWSAAGRDAIQRFAAAWSIPVAAVFRRQDHIDNAHPCYAGDYGIGANPKLVERVAQSDCVLALGPRLGEMTTAGYSRFDPARTAETLIHVHPDPAEPGSVFPVALAVAAAPDAFARALADVAPPQAVAWAGAADAAHAEYARWNAPVDSPGDVRLAHVVAWLAANLPEDTIVANGAGNYSAWVHRFHRYRRHGCQLAPTNGSMGYGLPAAVAAKLRHPDRTVVAFAGDGCFMMASQELATAVQHGAAIVVVIVNNGLYGTIRMHQERAYPGRRIATDLANPDFVSLAAAYGCHGARVTRTDDFPAAFRAACDSGRPAVIELVVDPEAITPTTTLSAIRASAG